MTYRVEEATKSYFADAHGKKKENITKDTKGNNKLINFFFDTKSF